MHICDENNTFTTIGIVPQGIAELKSVHKMQHHIRNACKLHSELLTQDARYRCMYSQCRWIFCKKTDRVPLAATPPSECPRKTYPRTTWQMELRQVTLNAQLGRVNMSAYNFFCVWTKVQRSSKYFFPPNAVGLLLINCFSDFRYVDPFRRYSRSKSKAVKKHAEFWTIFTLPFFFGGGTTKNGRTL